MAGQEVHPVFNSSRPTGSSMNPVGSLVLTALAAQHSCPPWDSQECGPCCLPSKPNPIMLQCRVWRPPPTSVH